MSQIDPVTAGFQLIRLGVDLAQGNITDAVAAARALFDAGTQLIPVDKQKEFLRDYDKRIDDLEADVLEDVKLEATGGG
jgi:hypothetical protein